MAIARTPSATTDFDSLVTFYRRIGSENSQGIRELQIRDYLSINKEEEIYIATTGGRTQGYFERLEDYSRRRLAVLLRINAIDAAFAASLVR